MFAEIWSVGRFFQERFGTNRGQDLNRHAGRDSPGHLQQIRLHVDDLVVSASFAREKVPNVIGLEPDWRRALSLEPPDGVMPGFPASID